jgi:dolichol-phosphate mannosyltransferase
MKKNNLVSVVIPTYKEARNIPVLCEKINSVMTLVGMTYDIIIVDDNSNDGTVEAVNPIKKKFNINLIVRLNEKGLSSAVIEGLRHTESDIVVVMDADLSHPPKKIPELVNDILNNKAEFTIGSRFVKGGSAPHFNAYRKLNAFISKMLARPFTKATDPMAGFFAFPRKILKDFNSLNPLGFKIGLELIVKTNPKKVTEIPIQFQERLYGESKLSIREQINYILHIKRLFEYKYKMLSELIKFGLIGGSGMIVDLFFVFLSCDLLSIQFRIARIIGFMFALTSNFLLNRRFTFSHGRDGNIRKQYLFFFIVSLAGFSVNWLISVYLHENTGFFYYHYLFAAFIGILAGMVINFTGSKFIVFRQKLK